MYTVVNKVDTYHYGVDPILILTPITSQRKFCLPQLNFSLYNSESFFLDDAVSGKSVYIGLPQYDMPRHSIDRPSSRFAPSSVKGLDPPLVARNLNTDVSCQRVAIDGENC